MLPDQTLSETVTMWCYPLRHKASAGVASNLLAVSPGIIQQSTMIANISQQHSLPNQKDQNQIIQSFFCSVKLLFLRQMTRSKVRTGMKSETSQTAKDRMVNIRPDTGICKRLKVQAVLDDMTLQNLVENQIIRSLYGSRAKQ